MPAPYCLVNGGNVSRHRTVADRVAELSFWGGMLCEPSVSLVDGSLDAGRDVLGTAGHLTLTLPASLTGALLTAASIPLWKERLRQRVQPRDLVIALAFVLATVFTATQVIYDTDYLRRAKFEAFARDVQGAVSFKDWLPLGARDVVHLEKMTNKVEATGRSVSIQAWQPEHRQFQIAAGPANPARVKTFYYPHWVASADGETLRTYAAPDGTLSIELPARAATVNLDFREPPRVRVAGILSGIGWLVIALLCLAGPTMKVLSRDTPRKETKACVIAN